MTSPTNVGQVSVDIVAEARGLAKSIRKEVEDAFKGLDVNALIRESIGNTTIKLPVDVDVDGLGERIRQARVPKIRVEADVDVSTIGARVRAARVPEVPVDVEPERGFEARLRALVARARATVHVDVDVDDRGGAARIGGLLSGVGGTLTGLLPSAGSLGGMFTSAAGAMAALAGAAGLAVPAITAVAGAAAAIPAALVGAGAIFGTLSLGFKGISDAFKPKAGGGGGGAGSAVNQAKQVAAASRSVEAARRGVAAANRGLEASERGVAAAERGVVQAQQALVDAEKDVTAAQKRAALAQQAVSKARVEAAEDIDDMNRALRGAKLSEEDAALSVTEALRALNEVKLTGNIPDIQRADLAYREALQTLDEAKDTTSDLQKTTDDANTKGVEGSDKVVSALQDQSDALDAVTKAQEGVVSAQNGIIDATDSLKSAQDGVLSAQDGIKSAADGLASAQDSLAQAQQKVATGGGAAAAAVTKLAPAATRFVNAIKALKPAFEDLRLDVQQRLLEGLDKTVTNLGNAWIPALKVTLGSYADTFNGFFKNLGASVTTPKFISDIQAGAEGARQGLSKIGDSVTTSLVPAFGALSRAAGPFLSQLGKEIADVVTQFSNWVLQGEKSGGLKSFFDKAAAAMHDIFTTGKLVGSIIGSLFEIITGSSGAQGDRSALDSFNDALQKISTWLKDPQNQQKIRGFITDVSHAVGKLIDFASNVKGVIDRISQAVDTLKGFGRELANLLGADQGATGQGLGQAISGAVTGSDAGGATSLLGKAQQMGRDLIDGITSGIQEKLGSLSLAGFFWQGPNSLVGRIKTGLGIASPSTVMMEVGRNLIDGLLQGIADKVGQLAAAAGRLKTTVTTRVSDAATWLSVHGRNTVIGLQNGIIAQLGALRSTAGNAKTTVQNALSTAGTWLTTHGRNAIIGLGNGIISMYGNLRIWAGNARVYITNALSNAGSLLVAAGKNVIIGLINGIGSMLGTLGNYLGDVGAFIVAHKGPPSKDKVMLYGAGQLIMGGLITGIGDKKDALAAELADVTNLVAGTTLPGLGAGMDAAVSASLQASSQQQVQVAWKAGATGDQILDALAGVIDLRYRGDVQAALSRS